MLRQNPPSDTSAHARHMNLLQLSHHCISVVLLQESHRGPFPLETARSIDEVKPAFLVGRRNIARSVTVTIPTTLSIQPDDWFNPFFGTAGWPFRRRSIAGGNSFEDMLEDLMT